MKLKQKEHVEVVFLVSLTCLLPDSNRWSDREAWMAAEYATDRVYPDSAVLSYQNEASRLRNTHRS
jgi:hypothetical protein